MCIYELIQSLFVFIYHLLWPNNSRTYVFFFSYDKLKICADELIRNCSNFSGMVICEKLTCCEMKLTWNIFNFFDWNDFKSIFHIDIENAFKSVPVHENLNNKSKLETDFYIYYCMYSK